MSQPNFVPSANGHATNGFVQHPRRTVDWSGYPTLFQRVAPAEQPVGQAASAVEFASHPPQVTMRYSQSIGEAFHAFCQAALFSPGVATRTDRPSEIMAASRVIAAAEAFGFTRDELQRLGCGLYASPAAVREDLRSMGFAEAEIDAAQLVSDTAGRPRAELAGCLVVPLNDETGHVRDFLCVTVGESGSFAGYRFLHGPAKSKIVAYGLQAALSHPTTRESLTLVDDVLDCLLLQCRGLHHVAAVGAAGKDFPPRRWEELARLGVRTATLAFRQDDRHAANVRDALVSALRARTAPEVFVANPYPASERSAVDVLRRFGKAACAAALASRSLAFHDKDFGAAERVRRVAEERRRESVPAVEAAKPQAVSVVKSTEPHFRAAFRQHLSELVAALPAEERSQGEHMIAVFDAAIQAGDLPHAKWLFERLPFGSLMDWGHWKTAPLRPSVRVVSQNESEAVASAAAILDRIVKPARPTNVPDYLADYAGRDSHSAIEWLINASPRGRVAMLCERIIDACERRPSESFIVVCCEHTERQIMLVLVTHLASRISTGSGLTASEVEARLTGREPVSGYCDKPWLVDEAADRIRLWSNRLTFVTCSSTLAGRAAVEQAIETARAKSCFGGLFLDTLPTGQGIHFPEPTGAGWITMLASRFNGNIVVATTSMPAAWPAPWPSLGQNPELQGTWLGHFAIGPQIVTVLDEWLYREQEIARA